jgi:hypothetical protein
VHLNYYQCAVRFFLKKKKRDEKIPNVYIEVIDNRSLSMSKAYDKSISIFPKACIIYQLFKIRLTMVVVAFNLVPVLNATAESTL